MVSLMRKIESLARIHQAKRVCAVRVRLGALAHMSPEHFGEHFEQASRGSVAEGAKLEACSSSELFDVFLLDVELEI